VLGALYAGCGFVPLNPAFPIERTRIMLERSDCQALVVGSEALDHLGPIIDRHLGPLTLLLPDLEDAGNLPGRWASHRVLAASEMQDPAECDVPETCDSGQIAYLLFTSGSTGMPKGVMVAHENGSAFIDSVAERYEVGENDRLSQTFDLTFDLSVFDMFVAWERGACLCCPSASELQKPGPWLKDAELTIWFSVPSLGLVMKRLGMLAAGAYPSLRWSLFCGEPLPASLAVEWSAAAPNAELENLYGPTELTIACTAYRWRYDGSPRETLHGLVPIGEPLPGMDALIADASGNAVPDGGDGELLMTGPQLTLGYWRDPDKTAAAFVQPPGRQETYYRTGDVVRNPPGGPMCFVGRVDSQVKIAGHRVEMAEVEGALRKAAGTEEAVAVAWPRTASSASGITAFVQIEGVDSGEIRREMAKTLPRYMVPRAVKTIDRLPLNANGKFDRAALIERLDSGSA
jgi:amino acid adenylation domain-containing protein